MSQSHYSKTRAGSQAEDFLHLSSLWSHSPPQTRKQALSFQKETFCFEIASLIKHEFHANGMQPELSNSFPPPLFCIFSLQIFRQLNPPPRTLNASAFFTNLFSSLSFQYSFELVSLHTLRSWIQFIDMIKPRHYSLLSDDTMLSSTQKNITVLPHVKSRGASTSCNFCQL